MRERIIGMNREEETDIKAELGEAIRKGELSEEDATSKCEAFMSLWAPGQRVFPVLPDYIKELQAQIATSPAQ